MWIESEFDETLLRRGDDEELSVLIFGLKRRVGLERRQRWKVAHDIREQRRSTGVA